MVCDNFTLEAVFGNSYPEVVHVVLVIQLHPVMSHVLPKLVYVALKSVCVALEVVCLGLLVTHFLSFEFSKGLSAHQIPDFNMVHG